MSNVAKTMNPLKAWVMESREEARRNPERYISHYTHLIYDDTSVMMTQAQYDTLLHNVGKYDGCLPTGQYVGKVYLRGSYFCWMGISKHSPMTTVAHHSREIIIIEG